jgi:hypothetical protein
MEELLCWIASRPRTYAEAMQAWRSTCPRHSVWEDALIEGLIEVETCGKMSDAKVTLTVRGRAALDAAGQSAAERGSE